ncbi:MAG: hypothetical protein H9W81_07510 [Enterococcus sp.]|nr:hypothetical protein [Enterococcus sp.]
MIEKGALLRRVRAGETSKEALVLMALPLVKTIAHKEYTRRLSWNSRVSFDDMIQEGIGGFLRGIQAYDVNGNQSSATNYLGQWILSDIRRHVETLDHDFSIPHETIERHRKIRAIRSHLFNKLGRTPTDEEIIDHANSGDWKPNSKMGKVVKDTTSTSKKLTQKNLEEERSYASATGQVDSIVASDNDDDYYERKSAPLGGELIPSSTQEVEDRSATLTMTKLFEKVFTMMGLGEKQEDIIRQKFGLNPYTEEVSLQEISKSSHLTKYKVNQIISAFTAEMSSRGSCFHKVVISLPEDEIEALGMGWVITVLGGFNQKKTNPVPSVLTNNLKITTAKPRTHFGEPGRSIANYTIMYECENAHLDTKEYILRNNIAEKIQCKECRRPMYQVK